MIVPTVTVKGGPKGTRVINAADFVPGVHVLADGGPPEQSSTGKKGGSLPKRKKGA